MTSHGGGVGLDLLDVERLERALRRRPRLAERLFTDAEREYARARGRPGQHLAARFCAKEAVAKALGLGGWSFRDVEVVATGGPPEVRLSGTVAERARDLDAIVRVSLTHTATTAGAVALVSPPDRSPSEPPPAGSPPASGAPPTPSGSPPPPSGSQPPASGSPPPDSGSPPPVSGASPPPPGTL